MTAVSQLSRNAVWKRMDGRIVRSWDGVRPSVLREWSHRRNGKGRIPQDRTVVAQDHTVTTPFAVRFPRTGG